MTEALSALTFVLALLFYGGASALFYVDVARERPPNRGPRPGSGSDARRGGLQAATSTGGPLAPRLLALGAVCHAAYVGLASFVAHVCPVRSVHFVLSVASLFAIAGYLGLRTRYRVEALGLLVSPLGLAFLLGTYFLAKPAPEPNLGPIFITLHVVANLLGLGLFLLAGGAAALYLVQERRIKAKKHVGRAGNLPPLDTLNHAVHRFLVTGFPLLTLGIVSGTYWAHKLELGSADDVTRTLLGYATWLLIAAVLLLRAIAGWRGRRSAYGTIAGLACALAVLVVYLIRPGGASRLPVDGREDRAEPVTVPAGGVGG